MYYIYTHICSSSFRVLLPHPDEFGKVPKICQSLFLSTESKQESEKRETFCGSNVKALLWQKKGIRKVSRFYLAQGMDMTSYLISYLYPKNVDICQSQDAILGKA